MQREGNEHFNKLTDPGNLRSTISMNEERSRLFWVRSNREIQIFDTHTFSLLKTIDGFLSLRILLPG